MESVLTNAFGAFIKYSDWIVWNLFLAFIPLLFSFWLFRWHRKGRSFLWWLGLIIFVAFLPNAPYLLTDIIHLIEAIRAGYSIWITTLVLIPLHLLAIFLGWEAYVISLINQSYYLEKHKAKKFIVFSEIMAHVLCAVGIYLGRFIRFNSWDLVTQPNIIFASTLNDLTDRKPLLVMFITFIILTLLYWLTKQINLGVMLQMRSRK